MIDPLEEWRPVVGYEGRYEVSNMGRVRSLDRVRSHGRKWRGRILKPVPMVRGYLSVNLWIDNRSRMHLIHRLVLSSFVGAAPDGAEVRHMDGHPSNNVLANLRWGTHSQNQYDQIEHGTHVNASKDECPSGHAYTPENTYLYPGRPHRGCRQCRREYAREWKAKNPERSREMARKAEVKYRAKRKAA